MRSGDGGDRWRFDTPVSCSKRGGREVLAEAVAASTQLDGSDASPRPQAEWRPGDAPSRRRLSGSVCDTSHFKKRSPWRKYPDEAIAAAAATSSSLREVVNKLGGDAGIRNVVPHKPSHRCRGDRRQSLPRHGPPPAGPLVHPGGATGGCRLGREHSRSGTRARSARRQPIARCRCRDAPQERNRHFALPQRSPGHPGGRLRAAVPKAASYADVMRALGLAVNDTNHRRIRRKVTQLELDTSHFRRRPWASGSTRAGESKSIASTTLVVMPQGSSRANRTRLHRALQEVGIPYRCAACGNPGEWQGQPITLQIDHISGDWLDNRAGESPLPVP